MLCVHLEGIALLGSRTSEYRPSSVAHNFISHITPTIDADQC